MKLKFKELVRQTGRYIRDVCALAFRHRVGIAWTLILSAIAIRTITELLPLLRYTSFYNDQARDAIKLAGIPKGQWPTLGPPNSFANYDLPPTYYYLLTPLLFISLNPALQNLTNDLTSLATIPLIAFVVYRLARQRWTDHGKSLLLAGGFALWVSISWYWYGTSVGEWCPYPIPFFAILILLVMDKILSFDKMSTKAERWYWLLLGSLIGLSLGLHSIMLILMPIFFCGFAAYALWRNWRRWPWVLASLAVIMLILTPYILSDASQHFLNTRTIVHSLRAASGGHGSVIARVNQAIAYAHAVVDAVFVVTDSYPEATIPLLVLCFFGVVALVRLDRRLGWLTVSLTMLYLFAVSGYSGQMFAQYLLLVGMVPIFSVAALIISPPNNWKWLVFALITFAVIASLYKGAKNIDGYIKQAYGANRLMSISDTIQAVKLIPAHGILCTYPTDPGNYLNYFYIRDDLLHRHDLTIRQTCAAGDYYIYPRNVVSANPPRSSTAGFTRYLHRPTYDILRKS
jgi:hypothetical protein